MNDYITKLSIDLEDQLQFINSECEVQQKRAEESHRITLNAYNQLQAFLLKHKFKTTNEEIKYFKIVESSFFFVFDLVFKTQ